MLRAFIDDSDVGGGPAYVLAGWIAPAEKWASFSDRWDEILRMSPRVAYFKFSEAMGLGGEFAGISAPSRDFKMKLFTRLIEEYELLGVSASAPRSVFEEWFGRDVGALGNPYAVLFYGIISCILRHYSRVAPEEKIDFVFDEQPGQMRKVLDGWDQWMAILDDDHRDMIAGPPIFRRDTDMLPLQAADMHAGWLRRLNLTVDTGSEPPPPPWGPDIGNKIQRLYWHLWPEIAE
jgi:hypothetical protein